MIKIMPAAEVERSTAHLQPTLTAPSPWIMRWTDLVPHGGQVLDVACGTGRHLNWLTQHPRLLSVTGVDLNIAGALKVAPNARLLQADIENGPWPLVLEDGEPEQFDAVIVTNYLWRPLIPTLLRSLRPGGVLLYETFAIGHETVGRPSRTDFLLRPGELLELCASLQIVAYENGFLRSPERFVQRIAAVRTPAGSGIGGAPERYPL
jgi:SAM-dependent methyltransferase